MAQCARQISWKSATCFKSWKDTRAHRTWSHKPTYFPWRNERRLTKIDTKAYSNLQEWGY